jgi:hypothetical protein
LKLQGVDLRVLNVDATARFFAEVRGLSRVLGHSSQIRLRGTDLLPYLIGVEQGPPAIHAITFCSDVEREVRGPKGVTATAGAERSKENPRESGVT